MSWHLCHPSLFLHQSLVKVQALSCSKPQMAFVFTFIALFETRMLLFIPFVALLIFAVTFLLHKSIPKTLWLNMLRSFFTWAPFTSPSGTVVSNIETKLLQDINPYVLPPLQPRTSTKSSMGLKRLDEFNWLTLDECYLPENAIRNSFLNTARQSVLQCLPVSMSACYETLELVSIFLSTRFPQHFSLTSSTTSPMIHNHLTGEIFPIGSECKDPFGTAARLAMEDFNILMKNPETGDYHLQASATLFPAGWKLEERIGTTMANLHRPVPKWREDLGGSVNRFVYQAFTNVVKITKLTIRA